MVRERLTGEEDINLLFNDGSEGSNKEKLVGNRRKRFCSVM